jgi:hypothetical protein
VRNRNLLAPLFAIPESVDSVTLDFGNCNFVNPEVLVSLAHLVIEGIQKGIKFSCVEPSDDKVKEHLHNVNWSGFINQNLYTGADIMPIKTKSALPLWRVTPEYYDSYSLYATRFLQNIDSNNHDWSAFTSILLEIFNNIRDHSRCSTDAIAFCQFFSKNNTVRFAISDLGVGIINTVNEYQVKNDNPKLPPIEALQKAFKKGFSVQSTPSNRGYGLDNLQSFLSSCRGELNIITEKTYAKVMKNGKNNWQTKDLNFFRGTLFVFNFELTNLPIFDAEIEEFYF